MKNAALEILGCGLSAMVLHVSAADVAFTGANGTDLADAANWSGGAVPGEGDVGVVDVATSGTDYSVSTNCLIGGLSFTNNTSTVVLTSTNTLTLGSGGMVCRSNGGTTFKLPLAVSGTQTWNFGSGPTKFYSTISGTDSLTMTKSKGIWHYYSPRYGGKITYTSISEWNNSGYSQPTTINFYEPNCTWANEIAVSCKVRFLFSGQVSFKTLFPGMSTYAMGSGSFGIEAVGNEGGAGGAGYPTLGVAEDEAISLNDFMDGAGDVYQTGGSLAASGTFSISNPWYYNYWYDRPSHYYLSAGTVTAKVVNIGEYGKGVHRMVQSGGTVTVSSQLVMGGGNQTTDESLAEYCQLGGDVAVTAAVAALDNTGTVLFYPEAQYGYGRVLYEMKGGTHTTPRILFGRNYDATSGANISTVNGSIMPAHNSYALFELAAGTLSIGAGGIVSGTTWNPAGWTDAVTNCYADVRLLGGTVKTTATAPTTVPIQLPHAGQTLTWETAAGTTHSIFAPAFGQGQLVKTGAGELALTDATAFKGTVDVQEGSLRLLGTTAAVSDSEMDCWQWTADAVAAAGATNGEPVSTWTDLRHGVAATNATIHLDTRGDVSYSCPQLVANAFNGHAVLRFDSSMLTVPADVNPFVGAQEMTVAFVFKETTDSWAKMGVGNYYTENTHLINPGWGAYNNAWGPWFQWGGGNRLQFMVDSGVQNTDNPNLADHVVATPEGVSLKDGIHVVLARVSEESGLSLVVDGMVTNRPWVGTYRPLFRYRTAKTALPLVIGCLFGDTDNVRKTTGLNIAELRVYTNALSNAKLASLATDLDLKYNALQTAASQIVAGYQGAAEGDLVAAADPVVPDVLPTPRQCWTADSLVASLDDGAEVTSWPTTNGANALSVESGCAAPTLVAHSANGHAAVKFDAERKTTLSAKASAALTKNDWNNWTMAVAFRATAGAQGRTGVTEGRGIVSLMKDETSANCFQFALITNGELRAYATTDKRIYQRRPLHLDDGEVHVAVFTSDMIGQYNGNRFDALVVDGIVNGYAPGLNPELAKTDAFMLRLGQLVNGKGFFSGEILELRWYSLASGKTLTMDETRGVCADLARKYGVRLHDLGNFGAGKVAAYGLGATNVSIAAGAQLLLPKAQTSPYTVGGGQTLSVAGSVKGTLALSAGGTLRIPYGSMPSFESIKARGAVTLDVVDLPQQSSRRKFTPIATVDAVDFENAVWTVAGEKHASATVDVKDGVLGITTIGGLTIIFR